MIVGEPRRISALNSLKKCSGLVAARSVDSGESGVAADTGTGVGRGVELWHRGYTYDRLLKTLRDEHPNDFPKADMHDVERIVLCYVNDERNPPEVVVTESLEQEVILRLDPDPDDPTGEPIVLTGHTDQVRYRFPEHGEAGGYQLWDVKNGRASGQDMIHDYAFQLAAYTIALGEHYEGLTVGGVIRTKGYVARGAGEPSQANVFFSTPWSNDQCREILSHVAYLIGQIRAGAIACTPGSWCRYCPLDFPSCLDGGLADLLS